MLICLRCYGCQNRAIVPEACVGYCTKCHIQLQYDQWLTKELCGKDNEKERIRLEKTANRPVKKHKIKKKRNKKKT